MELRDYQDLIKAIYFDKDSRRGLSKTFNWLIEEIGELARAIRKGDKKAVDEEIADTLAWLLSVASILKVDVEESMKKYKDGCPKCHKRPCR
ncbi:MAG: MazG nucleotide pyrophosphohydrolase domain-containing protein, partial [candidate division WOR-3 bacterium]